jgi:hypothetical protein
MTCVRSRPTPIAVAARPTPLPASPFEPALAKTTSGRLCQREVGRQSARPDPRSSAGLSVPIGLAGRRFRLPEVPDRSGTRHNCLVGAIEAGRCSGFVGHMGALEHRGAHPWRAHGGRQPSAAAEAPGTACWKDPDREVGRCANGVPGRTSRSRHEFTASDALPVPPGASYRPRVSGFVSTPLTSLHLPAASRADVEDDDRAIDQEFRPTDDHSRPLAQTARRG